MTDHESGANAVALATAFLPVYESHANDQTDVQNALQRANDDATMVIKDMTPSQRLDALIVLAHIGASLAVATEREGGMAARDVLRDLGQRFAN